MAASLSRHPGLAMYGSGTRTNHIPTRYADPVPAEEGEDEEPESPLDNDEDVLDGIQEAGDISPLPMLSNDRPSAARSSTDPPLSTLVQKHFDNNTASRSSNGHYNRSRSSRTHLRSRSSGSALSAPLMTRAHSSPSVHSAAIGSFDLVPVASNLPSRRHSPARQRSPFGPPDESAGNFTSRSPSRYDTVGSSSIESIQEDTELAIRPRQQLPQPTPILPAFSRSSSLRRRPVSPLHNSISASTPSTVSTLAVDQNIYLNPSIASFGSNSPSLGPVRYNEAYPPLHHYASSSSFGSVSSTPTSQRSRSPSISSLETIEDVPDLESQAIENERIERLKLAAERAERAERGEDADEHVRRRGSFDAPRGFGFNRGGNRERKRWSVCGAERRSDLDLETIWED